MGLYFLRLEGDEPKSKMGVLFAGVGTVWAIEDVVGAKAKFEGLGRGARTGRRQGVAE
jgi:hypothetical protein